MVLNYTPLMSNQDEYYSIHLMAVYVIFFSKMLIFLSELSVFNDL